MDNFKIIYKILKELEKNMGNEQFSVSSISAEKMQIPFSRWEQLMIMMWDEGYIKGLVVSKSFSDKYRHIVEPIFPEITLKGLEYLSENSFMGKAKDLLKMAGDFI